MEYMTKEYIDELLKRYQSGGIVWLIERTDKNEFYIAPLLEINSSPNHHHEVNCMWSSQINEVVVMNGFLSMDDAVEFIWTKQGISKHIPIEVFEHEFVV